MLFRLRFNRYTSYKAKSRPYYIKSLRSYTRMTETKLTPTFVDSHVRESHPTCFEILPICTQFLMFALFTRYILTM